FHADNRRFGSDADGSEPIVFSRDNPRDVSAMPESPDVLVEGESRNEGRGGGEVDVGVQILMRAVDSAVNDGHADAGAVEPRGPGAGRFDSLDVPLQVYEGLVTGRDSALFQLKSWTRLLPLDNRIQGAIAEPLAGHRGIEKARRTGGDHGNADLRVTGCDGAAGRKHGVVFRGSPCHRRHQDITLFRGLRA